MDRSTRLGSLAFAALLLSACGGESPTPAALCTTVLEQKVPDSEVVAIEPAGLDRPEITYALPAVAGVPVQGRLACEVERSRLGGLRLKAATLDGRPLSDTELVVLNANLLLDDLYRIGKRSG